MPTPAVQQRQSINQALNACTTRSLQEAAAGLLSALGYRCDKTADLGTSAKSLLLRCTKNEKPR